MSFILEFLKKIKGFNRYGVILILLAGFFWLSFYAWKFKVPFIFWEETGFIISYLVAEVMVISFYLPIIVFYSFLTYIETLMSGNRQKETKETTEFVNIKKNRLLRVLNTPVLIYAFLAIALLSILTNHSLLFTLFAGLSLSTLLIYYVFQYLIDNDNTSVAKKDLKILIAFYILLSLSLVFNYIVINQAISEFFQKFPPKFNKSFIKEPFLQGFSLIIVMLVLVLLINPIGTVKGMMNIKKLKLSELANINVLILLVVTGFFIYIFFSILFPLLLPVPLRISGLGYECAKIYSLDTPPRDVLILLNSENQVFFKDGNKTVEVPISRIKRIIYYLDKAPEECAKSQTSSQTSHQQKANSQSSGSQKTSKGGHQSQIQAERGQKGLQGKQERGDQRSLSSHRRKTSESAGSGEKRRQSKTYTRRQPDTAGQRE